MCAKQQYSHSLSYERRKMYAYRMRIITSLLELGFPAGTILIRDKVQQDEMEKYGEEMVKLFASRNDQQKELLANVKLRPPDETFDKERKLDLGGGVTARLLWFGQAHTKGDELIFV